MVSSDFGKLEVKRHFTSGEDWAMAGEATAAAAAPAAETFKNSRRFIRHLHIGDFSCSVPRACSLTRNIGAENAATCAPSKIQRKSNIRDRPAWMPACAGSLPGGSGYTLELIPEFLSDRPVD